MQQGPLEKILPELGVIPAAFRVAIEVAYLKLKGLIKSEEGFNDYAVRTYRSLVHDHTWFVARQLLVENSECVFVKEAGTEVMRCRDRFVFQLHKVDESLRINTNKTARPVEIQGQGYLWQIGAAAATGDIWLTIGHEPNLFVPKADRIVIGVAIEGGMTEYRNIDLDADAVASIGPVAEEIVRRCLEG